MGVDEARHGPGMTQQFRDGHYVHAALEEGGGELVSEEMQVKTDSSLCFDRGKRPFEERRLISVRDIEDELAGPGLALDYLEGGLVQWHRPTLFALPNDRGSIILDTVHLRFKASGLRKPVFASRTMRSGRTRWIGEGCFFLEISVVAVMIFLKSAVESGLTFGDSRKK